MKIAIVILNWNGKALLEQFLPSVVAYSNDAIIYIADNASTDDSLAFVATKFPLVKIIKNIENGGYAKGYNTALKQIEADVFCLLNSDIEVTKNWLSPVIKVFIKEPNTSIIQPKILDYKKKTHFEHAGAAGGFIDKFGYPYCRGRIFNTIEKDEDQYNNNLDIFWASGACFFIRKNVFDALNGFDESFFAHMEEIDLCWRAFNNGYTTKFVSASTVFHVGGATLKATNPKKTYLNFRNSLFSSTKNAGGNLFILIFTRLILDGLACFKFLYEFNFSDILSVLKAHLSFYYNLPRLLKQRKSLLKKQKYYTVKSIVWSYFVINIKSYKSL